MIDLHLHSNISDGTLSPEDLVRELVRSGIRYAALTDHDTIAGWRRFEQAARQAGLSVIRGVEISAAHPCCPVHLLGYFVEATPAMCSALRRVRRGRMRRNQAIVAKLAELGKPVAWESVRRTAGSCMIGRMHIARAMVAAGHVPTVRAAFDEWLARGRPAYVERFRLPFHRAIAQLHAASAVVVLAHPGLLPCGSDDRAQILRDLVGAGLDGVEAYHSRHNSEITREFRRWAQRHGVLVTGGSDYHGPQPSDGSHAVELGQLHVPEETWKALCDAAQRWSRRSARVHATKL